MSEKLAVIHADILGPNFDPSDPKQRGAAEDTVTVLVNNYKLQLNKAIRDLQKEIDQESSVIAEEYKKLNGMVFDRLEKELSEKLNPVVESLNKLYLGEGNPKLCLQLTKRSTSIAPLYKDEKRHLSWTVAFESSPDSSIYQATLNPYGGLNLNLKYKGTVVTVNLSGSEEVILKEGDEEALRTSIMESKKKIGNMNAKLTKLHAKLNDSKELENQIKVAMAERRLSSAEGGKALLKTLKNSDLLKKFNLDDPIDIEDEEV